MSDRTGGPEGAGGADAAPEPDFFDRLLARHAPSATRPTAGDVVRVRPRLAGPFERVEAVRGTGDDAARYEAPLWPATDESPSMDDELTRPLREIRTEHERTVVRTERLRERETPASRPPARPATDVPLLRPATSLTAQRPPSVGAGTREDGHRPGEPTAAGDLARPTPLLPGPAATPPATTGALRPAAADDDGTGARGAARAAMARRGARGGERVVHVQIGRLEVSAGSSGTGPGRPARVPARPSATVSLEDYLRRGREGDGGRA